MGRSHTTSIQYSNIDLKLGNWKEFFLGKLFDEIYKAKSYVKSQLLISSINNGIPFVSRTNINNGCDTFIEGKIEDFKYEKGNALIIGDTTATCYYQENDFICGDHIVVLRSKWLNKYNALFIKIIIEKDKYKYSYGRAFKMDLIDQTVIKLPVDEVGNPDYLFMEKYIKQLQYSDMI